MVRSILPSTCFVYLWIIHNYFFQNPFSVLIICFIWYEIFFFFFESFDHLFSTSFTSSNNCLKLKCLQFGGLSHIHPHTHAHTVLACSVPTRGGGGGKWMSLDTKRNWTYQSVGLEGPLIILTCKSVPFNLLKAIVFKCTINWGLAGEHPNMV